MQFPSDVAEMHVLLPIDLGIKSSYLENKSELGVCCFSKLKHMSPPPLFLLLDSSIHAQIISQLEGGRHNYANK